MGSQLHCSKSLQLSRNCWYRNKNAELAVEPSLSIGVSGTIAESLTDTQTLSSHQFSASFALLMPIATVMCVAWIHSITLIANSL